MTPAVRRAVAADGAALIPLIRELFRLEALTWDPERTPAALDRLLASADLGFIATADDPAGGLAGYAICTFGFDLEFAGRDAFLTDLLVAPAWRRHHLGRALLAFVEDEARARGAAAVHLMVRPENDAALALYRARGYAAVPRHFLSKPL